MAEGSVDPERAQFDAFKALPRDKPIEMINLVRFRDHADYPADHPCHGDGATGALHVLPLADGDELRQSGALAAVFVARAMAPLVAPSEVPAALFDLTPSEARVFQQITAGRTIAQTATELGVGDSTIKTHLLRLYDKTGVRRQAELVHMAASLNVPVLH